MGREGRREEAAGRKGRSNRSKVQGMADLQ